MVFQNYALYPHMTVYDNIGFSLRIQKADKQERDKRIRTIARKLGLEADLHRKPRQLSGGQRQRVAMGRAIVRQPQAFLMDEPLSNLDAGLRFQMRAEIANLQAALEVTTLYVTHDQVEAMTIGNRVAVMRRGRLLQFADPQAIYDEPVELFVARFIGSPPMNLLESTLVRADGSYAVRIGSQTIRLDEPEVAAVHGIEQRVGRPVVAAIRPERIEDAAVAAETPADRRLTGEATVRETLGSDVLVHFDVDGAFALSSEVRAIAQDIEDPVELELVDRQALSLIGRFSPKSRIRNGDRLEVALHPGAVQLFDPETGRSWRRDAEGDTR
jgi:multiple sugar transport system ATP-binding protein